MAYSRALACLASVMHGVELFGIGIRIHGSCPGNARDPTVHRTLWQSLPLRVGFVSGTHHREVIRLNNFHALAVRKNFGTFAAVGFRVAGAVGLPKVLVKAYCYRGY